MQVNPPLRLVRLPLQRHLDAVAAGFRNNRLLYVFAVVVMFVALLEAAIFKLPFDFQMIMIFTGPVLVILAAMICVGLSWETVRLARMRYAGPLLPALWIKLRDDYLAPQRISNAVHAASFMTLYMVGYNFIKRSIPTAHPFAWDLTFANWDKALHFDKHPFEWLAPVLNHPWITLGLSYNYGVWFVVMFGLWFWLGMSATDHPLRQRFLLGFTMTWFFGTCVLGTVFSSVGPCFYAHLVPGSDPYAPLMAWLHHVDAKNNLILLDVMDELWKGYIDGSGLVNGISAMPSMHVATSVLFAMTAFTAGKRLLGYGLSVFALLIMLGSVHLGWHYAIDGYAGAAIAAAIWWGCGKLVAWDRTRRGVVEEISSRPS